VPQERSRTITGVLIFAFLLRLVWAISQPRSAETIARLPDQQEYLALGRNLLNHGLLNFVDPRFNQTTWAYRMPGYPAVIAACGGSVLLVRILQSLIDTGTVLAVYLIASALPGETIESRENGDGPRFRNCRGVVAAILVAFNPFYVYFSGLVLSETIFTSLLTWGMMFLVWRRVAVAAIFLVAACYVRPAAVLLSPVIAAIAMSNPPPGEAYQLLRAFRRGAASAVFVGLLLLVALVPWAWRNHQQLGSWIWTTTNGGVTLYDGFNPAATGASDQRLLADLPAIRSMNEVERSAYLGESARQWAVNHLGHLPLLSLRKVLRSWSPVPLSAEFGRPVYRIASAVYAVPFDLLCLVGLFSGRINRGAKILLISPAALITVVEIMSIGSIRYRIPAEAALAVLAAVGIMDLGEWFFGKSSRIN
jgi:hypothetical protein